MIIFISDLHLEDAPARSPGIGERLVRDLRATVEGAAASGIGEPRLVLLGDVFELLKSAVWCREGGPRPWNRSRSSEVELAYAEVAEGIAAANEPLLAALRAFPGPVDFVAGNHDWALTAPEGWRARDVLVRRLPALASGRGSEFADEEHRVLAIHGHEWDPDNYTLERDRRVPLGDAFVVEVVAGLAHSLTSARPPGLELAPFDFLFEIDNVRPQTPRAIAQWLDAGLRRLSEAMPGAREAADRALAAAIDRLDRLDKNFVNVTRRRALWVRALQSVAGTLDAMRWKSEPETGPEDEVRRASFELSQAPASRYFIAGHTHLARIEALDPHGRLSRGGVYFNTGAWRRIHFRARGSTSGIPWFESADQGCMLVIYSDRDRRDSGLPAYEFLRSDRGV